jgi:putative molybdopterin biosynthesis protein
MSVRNRLHEIRTARGVSAADLARDAGVSRQTIYAVEDGSFVPNTTVALRLARALGVRVEEIFVMEDEQRTAAVKADLLSSDEPAREGGFVRFCRVNQRLIAVPVSSLPAYLPTADGVIESRKNLTVAINPLSGVPDESRRLLVAGCDPALSLLNELLTASGIEVIGVPCSSRRALHYLKKGTVHAAGSHLVDHATGDYNVPIIRRMFPRSAVEVVTFAIWEQGLVLRRSNPKSIQSIADLSRKDVTLINREKGSGSRDLLDSGLRKAGIRTESVKGYNSIARGHLAAAYEVATGAADCCIAPRSAARCFGLDFVPLSVERFDLSLARTSLQLPAATAVLDLLNRSVLRNKLQAIAGYDVSQTGQVLV